MYTTKVGGFHLRQKTGTPGLTVSRTTAEETRRLTSFINERTSIGSLVPVTMETVSGWVSEGYSLVARVGSSIVGHSAFYPFEEAHLGGENRSQVVDVAFQGRGIYTALFIGSILLVSELPGGTDMSIFLHKGPGSDGLGLVKDLGFVKLRVFDGHGNPNEAALSRLPARMRFDATKEGRGPLWDIYQGRIPRLLEADLKGILRRAGWEIA